MPIPSAEKKRRLIISNLMVEILRPSKTDYGLGATDRLVAYCIGLSTFGPRRLRLNKISDLCGLPRNTTRGALDRLIQRGWIVRLQDTSYVATPEFVMSEQLQEDLDYKYRQIMLAAHALADSRAEGSGIAPLGAGHVPDLGGLVERKGRK